YSIIVSQTGSGYSWRGNAGQNRITRSFQDLIKDNWGKYIYIRDTETGKYWSAAWMPVQADYEFYRVRHGIGYSIFEHKVDGIYTSTKVFVAPDDPMEYIEVKIKNESKRERKLDITTYFELALGIAPDEHREYHRLFIDTGFDEKNNALTAGKLIWLNDDTWRYTFFHSSSEKIASYDTDKESVIGQYRNEKNPVMMEKKNLDGKSGRFTDACSSIRVEVEIASGEEKTVVFTLGAAEKGKESYIDLAKKSSVNDCRAAFDGVLKLWSRFIDAEVVNTPDEALNIMTNIWLKYQAISCRLWGKSGLYQVSAGYGFRDQLQDSLIFLESAPEFTKKQLLLHAKNQFQEGDVYHWWFTIGGGGPRTNCSDDLLWLPFIMDAYLKETGDFDILNEIVPFADGKDADMYTHCKRAIEKCFSRFSPRGIPLMGDHDWNDGLSCVGPDMKGESFWVAEFLYMILKNFIPVA
ncbi:MAG TPA: glycosyl transferase family 36, partial [Clostridiaceae bacterium]|nr:glycosyl transferase family 36 [Clostridiaceae bacterium]